MSWEQFREENQEEYDRFLMELDSAEARIFNMVEAFTDEQLDFLLRLTQAGNRDIWQFSGVIAAERHKRRLRVPDG